MSLDVESLKKDPSLDYILSNFLGYATDAIQDQAIPNFFDGLLPTQRKHLLSLQDIGAMSESRHKKSSQVTANTQGNYRPVGVTYDVLVNMSQSFRVPQLFTDPEGLWGEPEIGEASAERYTEIRMSKLGEAVFFKHMPRTRLSAKSQPHGIVPVALNYTREKLEESYLPARLPALLLNGGTGMAVGIAQTFQPLSFDTLMPYLIAMAKGEKADISSLKFGYPANPAIISSPEEVTQALASGRGSIKVAGRFVVNYLNNGKPTSVDIVSLPNGKTYNKVGDSFNEWRTASGSDCPFSSYRNLSEENKTLLRFSIRNPNELSDKAKLDWAIRRLYQVDGLVDHRTVNMNALKERFPVEYNVELLVKDWLQERVALEQRVAKKDLEKAKFDLHRTDLLILLHEKLQEVSKALINSGSETELRTNLELALSIILDDEDFKYVSAVTVRQLSKLNTDQMLSKHKTLAEGTIPKLEAIVSDPTIAMDEVVKDLEWFVKNADSLAIRRISNEHDAFLRTFLQEQPKAPTLSSKQKDPSESKSRRNVWDNYSLSQGSSAAVLFTDSSGLFYRLDNSDFDKSTPLPKVIGSDCQMIQGAPSGTLPVYNKSSQRIEHISLAGLTSKKLSSAALLKLKSSEKGYFLVEDLSSGKPTHLYISTISNQKFVDLSDITNPQATILMSEGILQMALVNIDKLPRAISRVALEVAKLPDLKPEVIKQQTKSPKQSSRLPQRPTGLYLTDQSRPSILVMHQGLVERIQLN